MTTGKCFHEDCRETFTGGKPSDWTVLEPHPPTYGPHGKEVIQSLYRNVLENEAPKGSC
jgi:hypothetical protein